MQSCCFEFVRSTARFCSDMMTLGSGFPLKQGNLGNEIWSPGLSAKRRMFLSGTAAAPQCSSGQRALSVPLVFHVLGDTFPALTSSEAVDSHAPGCSVWLGPPVLPPEDFMLF